MLNIIKLEMHLTPWDAHSAEFLELHSPFLWRCRKVIHLLEFPQWFSEKSGYIIHLVQIAITRTFTASCHYSLQQWNFSWISQLIIANTFGWITMHNHLELKYCFLFTVLLAQYRRWWRFCFFFVVCWILHRKHWELHCVPPFSQFHRILHGKIKRGWHVVRWCVCLETQQKRHSNSQESLFTNW